MSDAARAAAGAPSPGGLGLLPPLRHAAALCQARAPCCAMLGGRPSGSGAQSGVGRPVAPGGLQREQPSACCYSTASRRHVLILLEKTAGQQNS